MEDITKQISNFIKSLPQVDAEFDPMEGQGLVSNQVIDSLGIIELITFLESKYHITISQDDLNVDNLDTVQAIGRYVRSKTEGQG